MIFLGDLVYPRTVISEAKDRLNKCSSSFWLAPKFANFESCVAIAPMIKVTKGIPLSSSKDVISFFEEINVQGVTLANNHVFDFDINITEQKLFFNSCGITAIGAGNNVREASEPYVCEKENLIIVSFGWNVIRCKYATESSAGVNPYEYEVVENQCVKLRALYPRKKIVFVFHWNYEFEKYPHPADREFAKYLIDLGVDAIVGHHTHRVQGFEYYKGKPIFYGLGNFYFPNANFDGFELAFPEIANTGLAVEIGDNDCKVFVTRLVDNSILEVVEEGRPEDIEMLVDLSSFSGMTHKEYIKFFKVNRVKTKALPIYRSYKHKIRNEIYDKFVMYRQLPVDLLSKIRGRR